MTAFQECGETIITVEYLLLFVNLRESIEVILEPSDIPVGKVAVVQDPFGNTLTLVDLSKGAFQNLTDLVCSERIFIDY